MFIYIKRKGRDLCLFYLIKFGYLPQNHIPLKYAPFFI
ncbi:hypothetical protein HMPREF1119_1109 [Haemophilus parainfluenzae HK2019]|uniref:Uncharacterized protein n=1 Tax=Haemophilus parainfluenzae HK2019 TaxID=1095746 RepID=A0ABP2NUK4_HAEPA|nr:hypothetical protein HMPREF1118_1206 [Haemophilus parainfluenzae HK262]EIJ28555.1 hypothetical protein HMPREF1119_1109 [Haemophilus parainfluenzae HK2019]